VEATAVRPVEAVDIAPVQVAEERAVPAGQHELHLEIRPMDLTRIMEITTTQAAMVVPVYAAI
jgi:hypothetical protein